MTTHFELLVGVADLNKYDVFLHADGLTWPAARIAAAINARAAQASPLGG